MMLYAYENIFLHEFEIESFYSGKIKLWLLQIR